MSTLEFTVRLITALMPITIIIIVCVAISITTKKHRESIASDLLSGTRSPTDEEAELIMAQVKPRIINKIIVLSAVFLSFSAIVFGVVITRFNTEDRLLSYVMAAMGVAWLLMYIGLLAQPLSEIKELKNKLYTVCDCNIADINIYTRFIRRSFIPVEIYHATIKDKNGYIWEADLPKDLRSTREGSECLVIIYEAEEKVNCNRKSGRYIYRRDIYVEK